jgi:glycosyltransferase involved in cell wall biosynthesis
MRIGIDARELGERPTGVGRFLAGLLREWARSSTARAHEFVLYAPEPPALTLDQRRFRIRHVPGPAGTTWEQLRLPSVIGRDRLDVFFAPAYTGPLFVRTPLVAAIYDVSFVAHPEWFRLREGVRRRWLTRETAAKARAVITLSEFSRAEIIERLGVPADRVTTIVPGIDPPRPPRVTVAAVREPRVLYVGSLFNRRHLPDLVHAIAALGRTRADVTLDIVGDDRTFPPEDLPGTIARLELGRRVRWHRYLADEQLFELYGRARAFAFLSEYEGLGLTPLEALTAGIPAVLYDTAVARESCGDAALYVAPGDQAAVVNALERLLFDDGTRAALLAAAPSVLARYDWERAAAETLAVLAGAGG